MTYPDVAEGTDSGGKYDKEATMVRDSTSAAMVFLLVVGGDRGSGFSVQSVDPKLIRMAADTLREVAEQIDRENQIALRQVAADIRREFGFDPPAGHAETVHEQEQTGTDFSHLKGRR